MLKVTIAGPRDARVVEAPTPRPKEDWALVKVLAAPMCTEYKAWESGGRADYLGHEAAGEVVEVAQPCSVKPGDRVVVMPQYPCGVCPLCLAGEYIHCQACVNPRAFTGGSEGWATYAQYLLKPASLLPAIPEGVSVRHASLACCGLGPSFGAFDRMAVDAFDTVLITGLGPVGLGAVINARYRGARVIGVDAVAWRADRAHELGADAVFDPTEPDCLRKVVDVAGGVGVDKALDCSGAPAAHRLCIDAVRRLGQVAFVGECWADTILHISDDCIRKGLTLHGSWHYNRARVPAVLSVIAEMPDLMDCLISHDFPMSRIQEAFDVSAGHQCAKIILDPWK